MKQVLWQNGLRTIKQTLDWFQSSGEDTDKTRRQDYSDEGVFATFIYTTLTGTVTFTNESSSVTGVSTLFLSELKPGDKITDVNGIVTGIVNSIINDTSLTLTSVWNGLTSSTTNAKRIDSQFNIVIGDNNTPSAPSINVRIGVCYDSNSERIVINNPLSVYNAANPTVTYPDGIGGVVQTPLSTGSINVPLTVNILNYVWIDYLLVTDTSVFTLQKSTGKKQYYKGDDGFEISVTITSTPPSLTSLLLGTVNLVGGGVVSPSTISLSGRLLAGIKEQHVKVSVARADRSNATTVYNPDTEILIDDHVKAIGTGTITPVNPHGLAPLDIGVNTQEILATHQKFMHSTGVVGDRSSTTSSLYLQFVPISPGDDYVIIQPLIVSEVALIDGITITFVDIPNPVTLLFSSSVDPDGTYWVYVNKTTKTVERTNVDPTSDITKLTLWSFYWDADPSGSPQNGNITSIIDLRVFGTTNNGNLDWEDDYTFKRVLLQNGNLSAPSLTFQSDPDTGIYRAGANVLAFACNGVQQGYFSPTTFAINQQLECPVGSAGTPSMSFWSDPDTGIYRSGTNNLSFSTAGVLAGEFDANGMLQMNVGAAATPSYTFAGDADTGIYHAGANILNFATNGLNQVYITATGEVVMNNASGHLYVPNGLVGTPGIAFNTDTDTGIFNVGTNNLGISAGGSAIIAFNQTEIDIYKPLTPQFDGTVGAPAYSWAIDLDSGIYRIGAGDLGISTNGIKALEINSSQQVLQPAQCCFLVYLNSTLSDCTGDGTIVHVPFATEVYDTGSNYNTGTYTFTAPVTGKYQFSVNLTATDIGGVGAVVDIRIETSNRTYRSYRHNAAGYLDVDTMSLSILADMDAGDTAYVIFQVDVGGKTVDIIGHASTVITSFSGSLIN